jgi:hypothetical protein
MTTRVYLLENDPSQRLTHHQSPGYDLPFLAQTESHKENTTMTLPADVVPLVREFASNSFRFLFRQGDNVGDLLRWQQPEIARRMDFAQLAVLPDTFVSAGFAGLESDVLLRGPFRVGRRQPSTIEVYILIEHQSEPDELMVFRVLRYVVLVYERQLSEWLQSHSNTRGFRFHPVLPIVFYSGQRRWPRLPALHSLVHQGKLFGKAVPDLEPVFVDLARTSEGVLQSEVGVLGWVLWLIQ